MFQIEMLDADTEMPVDSRDVNALADVVNYLEERAREIGSMARVEIEIVEEDSQADMTMYIMVGDNVHRVVNVFSS